MGGGGEEEGEGAGAGAGAGAEVCRKRRQTLPRSYPVEEESGA